jgi:hypothetical protein
MEPEKSPYLMLDLGAKNPINIYPAFLVELEQLRREIKELKVDLKLAQQSLVAKELYSKGLAADLEHAVELLKSK